MMAEENIRLKIVGVEDLKTVNGEQYDAVLVISTCLAWGFDEEVRSFIERHPNHDNMIFFTHIGGRRLDAGQGKAQLRCHLFGIRAVRCGERGQKHHVQRPIRQ